MDKIDYSMLGPVGGNAGGVVENVASSVKGAVCTMYNTYKDWYHANINLQSPTGALLEQFWNRVCPNVPPPLPPSPNAPPTFTGGQCKFRYKIDYLYSTTNYYSQQPEHNVPYTDFYEGGIGNLFLAPVPGAGHNGWFLPVQQGRPDAYDSYRFAEFSGSVPTKPKIVKVTPESGQPDDCGNVPGQPVPTPPPPSISTDVDVYGPGGNMYKVPISINPKIVIAKDLVGIDVNVGPFNFNPDINPQFRFDPNVNFNPNLHFNFGDDGVRPNFDLPDPNGNGNGSGSGSDNLNCDPCIDLTHIKNDTTEILDILKIVPQNGVNEFYAGKSSHFLIDGVENLSYVVIQLTALPTTSKIVICDHGNHSMYSGWIFFRKQGINYEKQQISSSSNIFFAPQGADGFSIQLTHNSVGECYYYSKFML